MQQTAQYRKKSSPKGSRLCSLSYYILVPALLVALSASVAAKDEPVIKRYSAVARTVVDFGAGGGLPQKLEFKIDNASGWLRKNGEFGVEGEIKHGSLLCGTYQLGIRFGIGSPQCTNVSWITDEHYVTKRRQCNNAWMIHSGADKEIGITPEFNQITCAQFLIKCNGKCR